MSRRPTIADVAQAAGMSISTVDRALNGREKVREETAQRIYLAAEKIGYYGASLIRQRLYADLPEFKFGFLLQKENQPFYLAFRDAIERAASRLPNVRAHVEIVFAPSQDPVEQAGLILELGFRSQVIAATAVNSHEITSAVSKLKDRKIPVFSLLNDFAQGVRQYYIGLNNVKIGRVAGWTIASTQPIPGKVAVFVGGHRWHGHELRETGFRSYFRENAQTFTVLDALVNLETRQVTYEATLDLLYRNQDLRGIFVAGGGMEGAIQAVREMRAPGDVSLVVNELTETSTLALQEKYVTLVDATPLPKLCESLLEKMVQAAIEGIDENLGQLFLQPDLFLPESI
ncbi:MAG: LacI family transcriptional regulator [Blastopirellula sp.]|nr:MAG: LacI family transcriptional regulator [Blastopirellula sp.]